jgi:para-nitrobenzyl esterase
MIATYWTNFAKTGNPNGGGLPVWPEYKSASSFQIMHLNVHVGAMPTRDIENNRLSVWDSL